MLFYSHITPHSTTGVSPAELLQNRRLRSRLDLLRPDIEIKVETKQQAYMNHNPTIRRFEEGEAVYIKNFGAGPRWIPGHVLSPVGNVSYGVKLYNGQTSHRHIDNIRKRFDSDTTTQPKHPPRTEVTEEPKISLDQTTPPLLNPSTTKRQVDNSNIDLFFNCRYVHHPTTDRHTSLLSTKNA